MKTITLKLSTMAMSLLAIGIGADLQGQELQEVAQEDFPSPAQRPQPTSKSSSRLTHQTASPTVPSAFDLVIFPGKSVGPITAETSYHDLVKIFDPARLEDIEASLGEGFTQAGTRVNLGEHRSFTVIWADATRTQIAEVRDLGADWHTPEGIQPGMSLEELEAIIGPFQFSGFAWDYGGTVMLDGTSLDGYESKLIVRLQPTPEDTHQAQALREVLGDELIDSNHSSFDNIHPVVDEIIVSLTKPTASSNRAIW